MTASHISTDSDRCIRVEGTCNCYLENDDDNNRKSSSLVYSTRFASMIVISLISLVTAKFVHDHIDECYEMAKNVLADSEDEQEEYTCYMEDVQKRLFKEDWTENVDERQWVCNGHCEYKDVFTFHDTFSKEIFDRMTEEINCPSRFAGHEPFWESDGTIEEIKEKYRELYLIPHCAVVYFVVGDLMDVVYPCSSRIEAKFGRPIRAAKNPGNIQCKEVFDEDGDENFEDVYMSYMKEYWKCEDLL